MRVRVISTAGTSVPVATMFSIAKRADDVRRDLGTSRQQK